MFHNQVCWYAGVLRAAISGKFAPLHLSGVNNLKKRGQKMQVTTLEISAINELHGKIIAEISAINAVSQSAGSYTLKNYTKQLFYFLQEIQAYHADLPGATVNNNRIYDI